MNEERERAVAADVRSRVIADCAALLPLARSVCAAMDKEDEAEVLRLFCGESRSMGSYPMVARKGGVSPFGLKIVSKIT